MVRRLILFLTALVLICAAAVLATALRPTDDRVPVAESSVGLSDGPILDGERLLRPVTDERGRITGWLSVEDQGADLATRTAPLLVVLVLATLGLAVLSLWQARRGSDRSSERSEQVDRLTRLPNQYRMREIVEAALGARAPDAIVSYAYLDIDRFHEVNDTLGAQVGDEVLQEIGARLRASLPPGGTAGRIGDDCFGVLVTGRDVEGAIEATRGACRAVTRPFRMAPGFHPTVTAGLAVSPRDGTARREIARRAQVALRVAKQRHRGELVAFAPDMEADLGERTFIKRELATALAERALDLHYQPIVAADGSGVIGVEALLRWKHPERGFIPPADFVRVAEESGQMERLGQFVLRRAVADGAEWPHLYVAVNLSPLQMRDPGLVSGLSALLAEAQFPPSRLVLEITEGVLIDNPEETRRRLDELRALGVRLALDDFGSGYSSLTYLQKLPFDKLKIDRGFVADLARSENGGVIIQAIVALGRALGMNVLVEGVETEEQRVLLRLAGCNEMQGFLFARPMPREDLSKMLAVA